MPTKATPDTVKTALVETPTHLVVNFQDTGVSQFPQSPAKAALGWTEYLNTQLKDGWLLTQVINVKIGRADQKHLVFYRSALRGSIVVVDLNSSIPNHPGTPKASQANLEGFLNSQANLVLLAITPYTLGVETRTLAVFLEKV